MRERTTRRDADRDAAHRRRLRENASRSMAVNLAETIELSHALARISGAARRR